MEKLNPLEKIRWNSLDEHNDIFLLANEIIKKGYNSNNNIDKGDDFWGYCAITYLQIIIPFLYYKSRIEHTSIPTIENIFSYLSHIANAKLSRYELFGGIYTYPFLYHILQIVNVTHFRREAKRLSDGSNDDLIFADYSHKRAVDIAVECLEKYNNINNEVRYDN